MDAAGSRPLSRSRRHDATAVAPEYPSRATRRPGSSAITTTSELEMLGVWIPMLLDTTLPHLYGMGGSDSAHARPSTSSRPRAPEPRVQPRARRVGRDRLQLHPTGLSHREAHPLRQAGLRMHQPCRSPARALYRVEPQTRWSYRFHLPDTRAGGPLSPVNRQQPQAGENHCQDARPIAPHRASLRNSKTLTSAKCGK